MRILSITVDKDDNENIQLVPQKASAGYTNGYADPEFLEELPKLYLPMLSGGSYRGFEIKGDSMLPVLPGSIIVGGYVDNWHEIKDGKTYVVVSKDEGVVYKRVYNHIYDRGVLELKSDNKVYDSYEVSIEDVSEVWEASMYISKELPAPGNNDTSVADLAKTVMDLQKEVMKLKSKD